MKIRRMQCGITYVDELREILQKVKKCFKSKEIKILIRVQEKVTSTKMGKEDLTYRHQESLQNKIKANEKKNT